MPGWVASMADVFAAFGRELAQVRLSGPRARESWKATLSVLLGLTASFLLFDTNDHYWAAFSAFMILRASVAETLTRGLYRVVGTVAGALTGFFLVGFAADHAGALLLAMMCVAFVAIYYFLVSPHSYAWMYFGLTAELVLTITLAAPETVTPFVALRVGEIVTGVTACVVTSCMFDVIWPVADPGPSAPTAPVDAPLPLWRGLFNEHWLRENRLPLTHAARGAVAFAVLFVLWRVIEFSNFGDSAVTSYLVLLVPGAAIRQGKDIAMTNRGMQRFVGCALGGTFAIAALMIAADRLQLWILALAAGVWIAAWVQNGKEGAGYAGSQFALALLVTFVQSNGPPEDILPAWVRFQGILVGVFVLSLVQAAWPLPAPTDSTDGNSSAVSLAGV